MLCEISGKIVTAHKHLRHKYSMLCLSRRLKYILYNKYNCTITDNCYENVHNVNFK